MVEQLFQNLINNSGLVFFLIDLKANKLLHLSPGYKKIWQKEFSEVTLKEVLSTIYEDELTYLKEVVKRLTPENSFEEDIHFAIKLPDGKKKYLVTWIGKVENDQGGASSIIGGVVSDFTKRKKYEEVILDYSSRKDAILETLIHDLSAPIKMVDNITHVLEEKHLASNLPELKGYTDVIRKACQTSVALVENLTQNEYIESSEVELKLERLDVVARVRSIFEMYEKGEIYGKSFSFDSSSPEIYAHIDDIKFIQVVNNLLSNALKFTPKDGKIEVFIEQKDDTVLLSVSDTGIGIPKENQPYIFDKFSKARKRGINGEPTIGLGLYIVRRIVKEHNGKVWFESQEDKGTSFFVEIPAFNPEF